MRAVPRVLGAAPAIYGKGIVLGELGSAPVTVKGVDPAGERTVTDLLDQVDTGSGDDLRMVEGQLDPVLLGRDLALKLGAGKGDTVTFLSPNGRLSPMGMLPRVKKLRVAGR